MILYKHDISRFVMCVIATFQKIHNATKMTLRRTRKFQTWCCYATRASHFLRDVLSIIENKTIALHFEGFLPNSESRQSRKLEDENSNNKKVSTHVSSYTF